MLPLCICNPKFNLVGVFNYYLWTYFSIGSKSAHILGVITFYGIVMTFVEDNDPNHGLIIRVSYDHGGQVLMCGVMCDNSSGEVL